MPPIPKDVGPHLLWEGNDCGPALFLWGSISAVSFISVSLISEWCKSVGLNRSSAEARSPSPKLCVTPELTFQLEQFAEFDVL